MEVEHKQYYKLTHPQKRIWYIEKIHSGSDLHNIGGEIILKGKVDLNILQETLNKLVERNQGLRLRIVSENGDPYQYISEFKEQEFDYIDFSIYEDNIMNSKQWVEKVFNIPFMIENHPLYYFALYKINEEQYGVLIKAHHMICDGWSMGIIQNQICEIYDEILNNREKTTESYSYMGFIDREGKYLESKRYSRNKEFWNKKFKDMPEEFLYNSSNSLEGKRITFDIEDEMILKIKKFIDERKISLNTFFITSILIYLNKTTSLEDIVIGTPVFNRSGKKEKNMIGMFTSTMPFRFKVNNEENVEGMISKVSHDLKECFLNQKYPYDILINDMELGKKGYDSLFKVCVNYYNSTFLGEIDEISVDTKEYYSGNQSYSLQVVIKEDIYNKIKLSFDYKIEDYKHNDILDMYKGIINIIEKMINNVEDEIENISLLSEEEINKKAFQFNSNIGLYPKNKTIYQLFEEQVYKTPNNIALTFENKNITYRELNEKSNQLASYLKENNVKNQDIIGIMAVHSIELVVGILGIMKSGAAYLPIDINYPLDRINYMLDDSKAVMVLTNLDCVPNLEFQGSILNLNNNEIYSSNKDNLKGKNSPNDLAYIIYTSGSTGKPKGVMIEHRGLVNYIWWAGKMYIKDEDDVFALYSSISFDLTVTSIFTPLISGNKIAIYYDDGSEFILYKILRERKATVIKLTPAHLTLIKDMDNTSSCVRRFIVGGDKLKVILSKEVYNSFQGKIEIYNEYGPTETVVGCMIYKYKNEIDNRVSVPIGVPADNVQIYILDKNLNIVPNGIVGELYISGHGVARGYLNRQALTKEKFINNPFMQGQIMYKTGDTATYLEDGNIEYVGRIDNQVKLRGYRIELGEIEKCLLEHDDIKDVFVTIKENSNKDKALNAYIISEKSIEINEIKQWLSRFLPKYMIPTNYVQLDALPLTTNGKIDVNALPQVNEKHKEFITHNTKIEEELILVMKEVLNVESISMKDNFYDMGGDSIKAIQITSKLKNKGLELKVKDILANDFIGEIAATISIIKNELNIEQGAREGIIEKTPIIKWFFSNNFKNENYYNQSMYLICNKSIKTEEINAAVKKLIEHHDELRINYNKLKDELYYNNEYLNRETFVEYFDLSEYCKETQKEMIENISYKIKSNLDIEKQIMFKVCIFDLGIYGQELLLTAHHLIIDGVSWRILLEDFTTILKQMDNRQEIKLPLKTHSFKEWANNLKKYSFKVEDNVKSYWKGLKENSCHYPTDFNKGEDTIKDSINITRTLDSYTTEVLRETARDMYGVELNEILVIALVMAINKKTGHKNIAIEFEGHGREKIDKNIDVSRTLGWFTTMYPAEFYIEDTELNGNIEILKEQLRNIPNKGLDFGVLKYLDNKVGKGNSESIRFNYLGDFTNIVDDTLFKISHSSMNGNIYRDNILTALLDITGIIINKQLEINIVFSKNKFKNQSVEEFIQCYIDVIKTIVNNSENHKKTASQYVAADLKSSDF